MCVNLSFVKTPAMTIQLHVLEKNMSLGSTVSYLPHLLSYETINLYANCIMVTSLKRLLI